MRVFNFVAAMIKRGLSADKNYNGQTEQVLVATRNNNGIMAAIMTVQMAWSHRQLADRGGNQRSVCHLLFFYPSLYFLSLIIFVCLSRAEGANMAKTGKTRLYNPFNTRTATLNLSRQSPEELYMRMQISESAEPRRYPDFTWLRRYRSYNIHIMIDITI